MKRKSIIRVVAALLCLAGRMNKRHTLRQLIVENLKQPVEHPKQLQVSAISEPDSAFGFCYFSQQEKMSIICVMKSITDSIIERTNSIQSSDINDSHVTDPAERQMRANSDIRQVPSQATGKKEWTGWKVKIDHQTVTHHGIKYDVERWFFISKNSKLVMRTFELPLP